MKKIKSNQTIKPLSTHQCTFDPINKKWSCNTSSNRQQIVKKIHSTNVINFER